MRKTETINSDNADIRRFIEIDGEQIHVTEEIYRVFKRPLWAEHKRKERAKRCRDENGFRCTKNCRTCNKSREGSILSLERFMDEGYDIANTVDIAEHVEKKLMIEELTGALGHLEPEERSLINALFFDDRTERDYAAEIGISHQAVGKRKARILDKLRAAMGAA